MKQLRLVFSVFCLLALSNQGMSQTLPNNDFESWNSKTVYSPDSGWATSNDASLALHDTLTVWKVLGFSGQAIHIQTAIIGTDTMFAYATNSSGMGVPYTGQPTNITGYYRYNIPGNDSAVLFVEFYKAGVPIATNTFMIKGTGSLSTFTSFSLPLQAIPVAPDTVFIGLASSNVMSGLGIEPASWIEFDQLSFTGTTSPVIVGGSFDSWTGITNDAPVAWVTTFGAGPSFVTKSTTHYSGSYSAKLQTQVGSFGTVPSLLVNGMRGTPYTAVNDTLTGYYMYSQTGGDSANVQAYLRNAGSSVGMASLSLGSASTWTYFQMPLTATSAPDTLLLGFISSTGNPGVTSTMYVDHIRFKSQAAAVPFAAATNGVVAYPNPAATDLNIRIPAGNNSVATITVFDAAGRSAGEWHYDKLPSTVSIPVGALTAGVYIYEVHTESNVFKGNFIKK